MPDPGGPTLKTWLCGHWLWALALPVQEVVGEWEECVKLLSDPYSDLADPFTPLPAATGQVI